MTSCLRMVPKFSIPISRAMWLSSFIDMAWSLAMLIVVTGPVGFSAAGGGAASSDVSTGLVGSSNSSESVLAADGGSGGASTAVAIAPSDSSSATALALVVFGLAVFFVALGIRLFRWPVVKC